MSTPAPPKVVTDPDQDFGAMTELVPEAAHKLGPAMQRLHPKARAFVMALVELGGTNLTAAAERAGYKQTRNALMVTASRMAADPYVQLALVEEAKALAKSSSLQAVATTLTIMADATAPKQVRLNAAARIVALAGIEPDKKTTVDHIVHVKSTAEQIAEVRLLAEQTGIDPRKLLGRAGIVVDAAFEVVSDTTGLEDMLG